LKRCSFTRLERRWPFEIASTDEQHMARSPAESKADIVAARSSTASSKAPGMR
jgi:hypothetical protein